MIEIRAINHVSLLVRDTLRSLEFYHGLLGLEIDASRPEMAFPGAWLRIGDMQIHLLECPVSSRPGNRSGHGGRDRHVAMDVADLDAVIKTLEAADIAYTLSRSGRRALFCRDPDDNALEFVEFQRIADVSSLRGTRSIP